jgi:hypothetical protein
MTAPDAYLLGFLFGLLSGLTGAFVLLSVWKWTAKGT